MPFIRFVEAFAVLLIMSIRVLSLCAYMCFIMCFKAYVFFYSSISSGCLVTVHVCMLTSLCDIILLSVHFMCCCVLGLAFCYICLFICFIYCILSLFNCTELPTWLLGWFADLLVTWLLTCNGRVGWLAGCPFG